MRRREKAAIENGTSKNLLFIRKEEKTHAILKGR
jgi:hypothetical protein